MNRRIILIILLIVAYSGVEAVAQSVGRKSGKVHYNAFSHNDYTRARPLWDAVDRGFNCVEADLWLIDGEIYVAHDREKVKPERAFEKLYIEPLAQLVAQNKGRVHRKGKKPFMLMIDCKSDGEQMLPVLKAKLEKYRSMFCYVENGKMHKRAILLFISGKRPMKTILEQGDGYMFLDGTISELGSNIDSDMMPVVSDNFTKFVKWNGEGEISQSELEKMRGYIAKTHAEGKLFRWWGAPDKAQFKKLFIEEGVDLIGADDLDILIDVIQDVK